MSHQLPDIPRSQAQPPFFVGVDLGGTSIKCGVVDDLGRTLSWHTIPTEIPKGPEACAQRMGEAVRIVVERAGLTRDEVRGVGLGAPGTMDIPAGKFVTPVNLTGWNDFPIRDRFSFHCGYPVTFANDANAAAYGEFWVGSGSQFPSLILLTLGTGIGGGIILGDLSVDGENSHGSECGHVILDYADDARPCNCGRKGHLEAYASGTAVIRRTRDILETGRKTSISTRLASGEPLTPLIIGEEAEAGDAIAMDIVMETARYLGIGITSLIHVIDPAAVILGGAMTFGRDQTPLGRRFLARIREEVEQRAFPVLGKNVKILYASLGGDAGVIGAAGRARVASRQVAG